MGFLSIFIDYWFNWLLGIIAAGIGFGVKHYVKLQKAEWERRWQNSMEILKEEILTEVSDKLRETEAHYAEESDAIRAKELGLSLNLNNLTVGILSIQSRQFKNSCEALLQPDHVITFQEYEDFESDYVAYKGLGGNHNGDALHDRVVNKYENQLN